jgi:hypothetical protein
MKLSTFTMDQIAELRALEKANIKRGGFGFRSQLQALITRLKVRTVSHPSDDPRLIQAECLWKYGFGTELGFGTFEAFLDTIPPIPNFPEDYAQRFPDIILVDARISVTRYCALLAIQFPGGDNRTFMDYDPEQSRNEQVYWMRAQDGTRYKGKDVQTSRELFARDEWGLTVKEGIAFFAQHQERFLDHGMDLPGAVLRVCPLDHAFIHWTEEDEKCKPCSPRPELFSEEDVSPASDRFGSATRGA